jgi:hypothetical protein
MDWKQTAKTAGIVWVVLRILFWFLTPTDKEFNRK